MSSPRPIRAAGGLLWRKKDGNYEIAIIQRPRYDDWSLPKGKLHDGETWLQAAVREVKEETGYTAQPLSFAGAVSYVTANRPKVVCFWHMLAVGEPDSRMEDEVSEVIWLPLEAARDRLEYPLEKALLEIWEAPGAYRN
jgi:8-oxo-dGTP diphosphatase